jgi:CAAX prenyl protease-like protein
MPKREGHGWWPYLLPLVSFLVLSAIGERVPESVAPLFAALKVGFPLVLLVWFWRQPGTYPELRGYRPGAVGLAMDVGVGLLGAVIWMVPVVMIKGWREAPDVAFDPAQFGTQLVWLNMTIRTIGYGIVTPFAEELFMRGWLVRYLEVFDKPKDFRDIPIGHYDLRSLIGILIFFCVSHVWWWEYPIELAWAFGTMLWFYYRKHLMPLVIVHAVTNLAILAAVVIFDGRFMDEEGNPISLWFFV